MGNIRGYRIWYRIVKKWLNCISSCEEKYSDRFELNYGDYNYRDCVIYKKSAVFTIVTSREIDKGSKMSCKLE